MNTPPRQPPTGGQSPSPARPDDAAAETPVRRSVSAEASRARSAEVQDMIAKISRMVIRTDASNWCAAHRDELMDHMDENVGMMKTLTEDLKQAEQAVQAKYQRVLQLRARIQQIRQLCAGTEAPQPPAAPTESPLRRRMSRVECEQRVAAARIHVTEVLNTKIETGDSRCGPGERGWSVERREHFKKALTVEKDALDKLIADVDEAERLWTQYDREIRALENTLAQITAACEAAL